MKKYMVLIRLSGFSTAMSPYIRIIWLLPLIKNWLIIALGVNLRTVILWCSCSYDNPDPVRDI